MSNKQPPTHMGNIKTRCWGDGGLDNSAAPNNAGPSDKGGSDGGMENKKIKPYGRQEGGSYSRAKTNARPNAESA